MAQETYDDALEHAERVLARREYVPQNTTPLMKIVMSGQSDPKVYREILTDLGFVANTLNDQDSDGMTALMYAAKRGLGDVALELLTFGAEKGLKNVQGETAADIWESLPNDEFDDNAVKVYYLNKLRAQVQGARRRQKTRKGRGKKQSKRTRRTYALRK